MARRTGVAPSLAMSLIIGAGPLTIGGCASTPSEINPDCTETNERKVLWGLLKTTSREFSETCSSAQFSAQLVRTFEGSKTNDKDLVAFYAIMERYFQGSDEKRAKFDKAMVRAGFDPKRIEEVSRRYGPVEAGIAGGNCPESGNPKFAVSVDGKTTTMRLGCFNVASDGKVQGVPGYQPPAQPAAQAAPAVAAP